MKSHRLFAVALVLSLLVHAIVIGVGVWYAWRHIAPMISLQSGSGGDGIRVGDIYVFTTPDAPQLHASLPSAPMMMDIITAMPETDVQTAELDLATGFGQGQTLPEPDFAHPAWQDRSSPTIGVEGNASE